MAKIGIFEDDERSLIARYRCLNENHETHVAYIPHFPPRGIGMLLERFEDSGFSRDRVYFSEKEMPKDLDVYFTDGLNDFCFYVAEHFGRDKTFILTDDKIIQERAKREEFNLVDRTFGQIIQEV